MIIDKYILKNRGWLDNGETMSGCNVYVNGKWRLLSSFVHPNMGFALCHENTSPPTTVLHTIYEVRELDNLMSGLGINSL